jgi:hypothetical protein
LTDSFFYNHFLSVNSTPFDANLFKGSTISQNIFSGVFYRVKTANVASGWQAKLAVPNSRTSPDAPQNIPTGDRRGWRPSRRKPQGLLYFYRLLRDQCELA